MTSGFSGSPAPTHSRSVRMSALARSAWTSIRQTVGGAHSEVMPQDPMASSRAAAENRSWPSMNAVAPAVSGANTLLHACFAQPGEDTFRCTSPGCRPIQYRVDRCPAGYEACVCSTSLGCDVVPEVKYSSNGSCAPVAPSGSKSLCMPYASLYGLQPSAAAPPTAILVQSPASPANLGVSPPSVST